MQLRLASCIVAALGLLLSHTLYAQAEIAVETLFKKPEFRSLQLSPNGKLLAALSPLGGRMNLSVVDLQKNKAFRVTDFKSSDVNTFFWVSDNRLVFRTGDEQGFEFRGDGGVYAINADGSEPRELAKPYSVQSSQGAWIIRIYHPLTRVRGSQSEIFVSSNERSSKSTDLYKVNTRTGRKTLVTFETPGNVTRWILDKNQVPRAAVVRMHDRFKTGFYYRADEKSPWQLMYEWGPDEEEIEPVGFDKDDKLYVTSDVGRDTKALFTYDIAAKKLKDLIYADERYDITPPNLWQHLGSFDFLRYASEEDQTLVGLTYVADKLKTVWFDPRYQGWQREIDKALPATINNIGILRETMLVSAFSDRNPGTWFLFDRSKASLTELLSSLSWIKPVEMVEMKPIKYTARDGMEIHGYLTLPKSYQKGKPVAMIVHPHGGPWARDAWGYNPEVQFLANRGYAVLQVNFRSSTGYGKNLYQSGYKQWGDKVQDDITDGVLWAIKEGYADKDKIGIYGASFGGYSTLMQLVKNPDMYKLGINYVGVTDMFIHHDTQYAIQRGDFQRLFHRIVGDPSTDKEMFERTSPARHVDKIKVPVMHAYGGEDYNVNIENGNVIKRAFEKAGKEVDYMYVAEEAHGYREDKNVFAFYNKMDSFLKKNLPAR